MIYHVARSFTEKCPHCHERGLYEEYYGIVVCFYCGYRNGEVEPLRKFFEVENLQKGNTHIRRKLKKTTKSRPRIVSSNHIPYMQTLTMQRTNLRELPYKLAAKA